MKTLPIVLAAASLAAMAAPAAAQCTCVTQHRMAHRLVRHAMVRHVRTRVVVREVVRPIYVDRPAYRPAPVEIDDGLRFDPRERWVGPPIRHRWREHHWRHAGPVRYDHEWRDDDDWRDVGVVYRF